MSKGQHLSHHQQGIVKRYYASIDGVTVTKLQELTSDIFLAETDKAKDRMWKSVEAWLTKTPLEPAMRERIVKARDPKLLAEFVNKLSAT